MEVYYQGMRMHLVQRMTEVFFNCQIPNCIASFKKSGKWKEFYRQHLIFGHSQTEIQALTEKLLAEKT